MFKMGEVQKDLEQEEDKFTSLSFNLRLDNVEVIHKVYKSTVIELLISVGGL